MFYKTFQKQTLQGIIYIQGHNHDHFQYPQEEGFVIIQNRQKYLVTRNQKEDFQNQDHDPHPEKQKETYDGNKSPPRNKSIKGHSLSQRHCDKTENLNTLINGKNLSVQVMSQSKSRSKSRSSSQSMPRRGKKIVDASRKVDTSLETSIDTSQNLNDSRACSTPLTIDERQEDSPSSRADSQNNGTNGPKLCRGQLDNLPSPRRKGLRSSTELGPPNRDSLLERTFVKERHIRKTRQSCKKNHSTVTPVVPNEKGT